MGLKYQFEAIPLIGAIRDKMGIEAIVCGLKCDGALDPQRRPDRVGELPSGPFRN